MLTLWTFQAKSHSDLCLKLINEKSARFEPEKCLTGWTFQGLSCFFDEFWLIPCYVFWFILVSWLRGWSFQCMSRAYNGQMALRSNSSMYEPFTSIWIPVYKLEGWLSAVYDKAGSGAEQIRQAETSWDKPKHLPVQGILMEKDFATSFLSLRILCPDLFPDLFLLLNTDESISEKWVLGIRNSKSNVDARFSFLWNPGIRLPAANQFRRTNSGHFEFFKIENALFSLLWTPC